MADNEKYRLFVDTAAIDFFGEDSVRFWTTSLLKKAHVFRRLKDRPDILTLRSWTDTSYNQQRTFYLGNCKAHETATEQLKWYLNGKLVMEQRQELVILERVEPETVGEEMLLLVCRLAKNAVK